MCNMFCVTQLSFLLLAQFYDIIFLFHSFKLSLDYQNKWSELATVSLAEKG